MTKTLCCSCGEILEAETGPGLYEAAAAHVERAHPELILRDSDALGLAPVGADREPSGSAGVQSSPRPERRPQ